MNRALVVAVTLWALTMGGVFFLVERWANPPTRILVVDGDRGQLTQAEIDAYCQVGSFPLDVEPLICED